MKIKTEKHLILSEKEYKHIFRKALEELPEKYDVWFTNDLDTGKKLLRFWWKE